MRFPTPCILLLTALSVALLGCDSDGDDDGNGLLGSFNITISGDYSASFSGQAVFANGTDPATGQSGFALVLSENIQNGSVTGSNAVYIGNANDDILDEGTYTVIDTNDGRQPNGNEVAGFFVNSSGNTGIFLTAVGGTLQITDVDDSRLSGEINFAVTGFDSSDPEAELSATITGSFTAIGGAYIGLPVGL